MASPKAVSHPVSSGRLRPVHSRSSYFGVSPLAEAAIARDLEEDTGSETENAPNGSQALNNESDSDSSSMDAAEDRGARDYNSMVGSYRRPSYSIAGSRATVAAGLQTGDRNPTRSERHEARREERSLLRDNNVIPPKHALKNRPQSVLSRISDQFSSFGVPGGDKKVISADEESAIATDGATDTSETAPLLRNPELPYGGQDSKKNIDQKWAEAVEAGKIHTTWQREAKVLFRYSAPLVLTFLLQYSLTIASIFTVGHLGTVELAAVSLASMTANITGYAVYQGLATSLDTLCAQAYGSGKIKLVGLQTQRMV